MTVLTGLWTDQDSPSIVLSANGTDTALNLVFTDNGDFTGSLVRKPAELPLTDKIRFTTSESNETGSAVIQEIMIKYDTSTDWEHVPAGTTVVSDAGFRFLETDPDNIINGVVGGVGNWAVTSSLTPTELVAGFVQFTSPQAITEVRITTSPVNVRTYDFVSLECFFDNATSEIIVPSQTVSANNTGVDAASVSGSVTVPDFADVINGTVTITGTDPDGLTDTQLIVIAIVGQAEVTQAYSEVVTVLTTFEIQATQSYVELLRVDTGDFDLTQVYVETIRRDVGSVELTQAYVELIRI